MKKQKGRHQRAFKGSKPKIFWMKRVKAAVTEAGFSINIRVRSKGGCLFPVYTG